MRFSTVVAGLSALAVPAVARSLRDLAFDSPTIAGDDDHKIPGESPLELCSGEHGDDLIIIKNVDLTPNPPKAGQELLIKASGTVKQAITKGAYVSLTVKYGLIKLLTTKADLCDQIGNVDLECPVEPGELELTKSVDLPNTIPPGKYTVEADVYTEEGVKITCLTATVAFSRGAFFNEEL